MCHILSGIVNQNPAKPTKPSNTSILRDHIGFYGIVWKSTAFLPITIVTASWFEKKMFSTDKLMATSSIKVFLT